MNTKASTENLSKSAFKDGEKNSYIQVFLRVRPFNQQEINKHALQVVDTPGSTSVVVRDPKLGTLPRTFTFDRVFGPNSRQIEVYKTVVAPLIAEVLLGYNCTVFAYGQTGTGKTFTMEGERCMKNSTSVDSDPLAGILPRALSQLFDEVRMMNCEFTMRVSFLELYNEELFDLLAPIEENKPKTLRLFEDSHRKGSVIIQGLEEVIVQNKHEVYAVLDRGSQQRKTAATLMNATSSRSHTVFTITVHMKESSVEGEEMLKVGKLNLVDLAGSENIGKSGAVDKRAREAGSINQSLLTLGRVITALTEKTPHVPYRESKLTRLLQDSLGGKTKTSIIATIGPAASNLEETFSTLEYACRAKSIQNKPEVNQRLTKKEALNIYTDEIERLRRDLNATREKNGIYVDLENYNRTMSQIESLNRELNEKSEKIRELEETVVSKDEEIREANALITDLTVDVKIKQTIIDETKARKKSVEKNLVRADKRIDELTYLIQYHEGTEESMKGEAEALLHTTTDTVSIIESLHEKLDRKRNIEERNWKNSQRFRGDFREVMDEALEAIKTLKNNHAIHASDIQRQLTERCSERRDQVESYIKSFVVACVNLQKIGDSVLDIATKFEDSASEKLKNTVDVSESQLEKHKTLGQEFAKVAEERNEKLKNAIMEMQKEAKNLQSVVNSGFSEMSEFVLKTLNDTSGKYEIIDGLVKEMWDFFNNFMDQAKSKISAFENNNAQFKQCHSKQLELMEQTIQSMRMEMEGMLKQSSEGCAELDQQMTEMNTKLGNAVNATSNCLSSGKSMVEGSMAKYSELRNELNTTTVEVLESMVDKLSVCSKDAQDSVDAMNKYKSGTDANYAVMVDNYKKCNKEISSDLRNVKATMTAQFNQHKLDITKVSDDCLETIKDLNTGEDNFADKMIDSVDDHCDEIDNYSDQAMRGCCQLVGMTEEFWDQTYLTDSPTGATPCRKRFEYPQRLTNPSPRARVLERYHKFNRDVRKVVEKDKEPKDDDDSDSGKSDCTLFNDINMEALGREMEIKMYHFDNNIRLGLLANDENEIPDSVFLPPHLRPLETINESTEPSAISVDESKNVASGKPEPSTSEKSSKSDSGSDGDKSPRKVQKMSDDNAKENTVTKSKGKNKRGTKGILKTPNK